MKETIFPRCIGGGVWDGEDVVLYMNDETGEIDMVYMGEVNND
jgi:hypothetical protein